MKVSLKLRAEFSVIVAALIVDLENAGRGWGFINHPLFKGGLRSPLPFLQGYFEIYPMAEWDFK